MQKHGSARAKRAGKRILAAIRATAVGVALVAGVALTTSTDAQATILEYRADFTRTSGNDLGLLSAAYSATAGGAPAVIGDRFSIVWTVDTEQVPFLDVPGIRRTEIISLQVSVVVLNLDTNVIEDFVIQGVSDGVPLLDLMDVRDGPTQDSFQLFSGTAGPIGPTGFRLTEIDVFMVTLQPILSGLDLPTADELNAMRAAAEGGSDNALVDFGDGSETGRIQGSDGVYSVRVLQMPVPEPGGMALLFGGVFAATLVAARRRGSAANAD